MKLDLSTGQVSDYTPEELAQIEADFAAQAAAEAARVPESVTRYQMQIALVTAGLYETVEAYVNGPDVPLVARIAWNTALEYYRNSPFITLATTALGMTESQIDDLFRAAATVG